MNRQLENFLRRFTALPMIVWMLLSAVLFLTGAAHFSMAGQALLAKVGVLGAIAAVAVIAAFSG